MVGYGKLNKTVDGNAKLIEVSNSVVKAAPIIQCVAQFPHTN